MILFASQHRPRTDDNNDMCRVTPTFCMQFEMMLLLCCGYHDYANRTVNQSYNVVSVVGGYVSGQMSGNTNDLMHHSLDEAFLKGVWGWWMVMRMVERFFSRRVLTVLIQVYEEEAHI